MHGKGQALMIECTTCISTITTISSQTQTKQRKERKDQEEQKDQEERNGTDAAAAAAAKGRTGVGHAALPNHKGVLMVKVHLRGDGKRGMSRPVADIGG